MPRAVVYLRVSTDEQTDSKAGLNAQRDACAAWCAKNGYDAVGPFVETEGVSGATPVEKRPALLDALAELARGDVLLVQKRDRIARSGLVLAMLESLLARRKCRLVSSYGEGTEFEDPEDPFGFLQRKVADLFAEYERLQTKWRTRMALRAKQKRSERTGRVPYGYDLADDGRRSRIRADGGGGLPIALVPNARERLVLKRMVALRAAGWTYARIAWAMNRQGLATKAGKPWKASSIHHLVRRWTGDPEALAALERLPDDYVAPPPPPGPEPNRTRPGEVEVEAEAQAQA